MITPDVAASKFTKFSPKSRCRGQLMMVDERVILVVICYLTWKYMASARARIFSANYKYRLLLYLLLSQKLFFWNFCCTKV